MMGFLWRKSIAIGCESSRSAIGLGFCTVLAVSAGLIDLG